MELGNVSDSSAPTARHDLEAMGPGDYFVALITANFLRSPQCWDELAVARRKQLRVRVLLQEGTTLPPGMLGGLDDCRVLVWATDAELAAHHDALVREIEADRGP